jgi:hypothetical protein
MGIYITEPSTNEEDIQFIQELIQNGKAYINNDKIYKKKDDNDTDNDDEVLWESCDLNVKERFIGDPGPFNSIFGYGRFTRYGYTFIFLKLQSLGRTTTTY